MMQKKLKILRIKLDPAEKEIEDLLPETLKALPISKDQVKEQTFAKMASAYFLKKNTKINIRLSEHDVGGLRRIAVREGLPYQTLIGSVLHKYVATHL